MRTARSRGSWGVTEVEAQENWDPGEGTTAQPARRDRAAVHDPRAARRHAAAAPGRHRSIRAQHPSPSRGHLPALPRCRFRAEAGARSDALTCALRPRRTPRSTHEGASPFSRHEAPVRNFLRAFTYAGRARRLGGPLHGRRTHGSQAHSARHDRRGGWRDRCCRRTRRQAVGAPQRRAVLNAAILAARWPGSPRSPRTRRRRQGPQRGVAAGRRRSRHHNPSSSVPRRRPSLPTRCCGSPALDEQRARRPRRQLICTNDATDPTAGCHVYVNKGRASWPRSTAPAVAWPRCGANKRRDVASLNSQFVNNQVACPDGTKQIAGICAGDRAAPGGPGVVHRRSTGASAQDGASRQRRVGAVAQALTATGFDR
jgi:hypothetical protein